MAAVDEESLYRLSETLQMIHNTLECAICLDLLRDAVSTRCGHPFCRQCLNDLVAHSKNGRAPCPLCNATVTRRGINDNEKLRRLVQGVHGLISAVRQDTGIDIMIQSRGPRMSSREAFSPSHDRQKRTVVDRTAVATSSETTDGSSGKVESWLMKLPASNSPNATDSQQPADVISTEDTDSEEMVSVSQIIPEQIRDPPVASVDAFDKLMLEYRKEERKLKTQASNNIEDDGDDTSNLSSNENEWTSKKKPNCKSRKGRSVARKRRTPVKKRKFGSVKDSVAKLIWSKKNEKSDSPKKGSETVQVVHPVEVIKDSINEKENCGTRSPGWSRVKQMKKEFHDPGKSVLKYQNPVDVEQKDSSSPPSIENECSSSTSDSVPCLNLSLRSPDLRTKEKVNEIVSTIETEIEIYERSCQSKSDGPVISNVNLVLTPEKAAVVQVDAELSPIPSRIEEKQHNKSNENNSFRTGVNQESVDCRMRNVKKVCFLKLGKMSRCKAIVRFLRLGRLSQSNKNSPSVTLPSTPPRRCHVQVQTSPSLYESQPYTCDTQFSSPFAVPFPGIEPKRRSSRGEKKTSGDDTDSNIKPVRRPSRGDKKILEDNSNSNIESKRRSSRGETRKSMDSDTMMDAETIILSQPVSKMSAGTVLSTNNHDEVHFAPNGGQSVETHEVMTSGASIHESRPVKDAFSLKNLQEGKSGIYVDIASQDSILNGAPNISINNYGSSKRARASSNSGESSDSDPGFLQNSHTKKKKKNIVLSDKVMTSGASIHESRPVKDAFSLKNVQEGKSGIYVDIASQDSILNGAPNISINNYGSSNRARASSNSGQSSDSDPGFLQNSHTKKKKKNIVLSDNESNSPVDFQDMSLLEECDSIVNKINANIEAELDDVERKKSTDSAFDEPKRGFSPNWYDPISIQEDDPLPGSLTPKSTISPAKRISAEAMSRRPATPKTQGDLFEDQSDAPEPVKAQIDTDSDSDMVLATPVKQTSFNKRVESLSEDIVPNSQPGDKPHKKQAINTVSNLLTSHQDISIHARKDSTIDLVSASPQKDLKSIGCSSVLQGKEILGINPLPSPACDKAHDEALQVCPSKPTKFGFACSGLPANCISQVVSLAKLVGAEFSPKFETEIVTHLVVRANANNTTDKTLKYLNAVASGKWIVSMKWVLDCLKEKKLVPEDKYEVLDSSGEPGPRRSRTSTEKLFQNFEFCCIGPFADLTKEQMEDLLSQCGATLVSAPTKFSFKREHYCIILVQYDEEKEQEYSKWLEQYCAPVIQHDWVLECLGKFAVTSFWQLLVCDISEEQLSSMGFPPYLIDSTDADSSVAP